MGDFPVVLRVLPLPRKHNPNRLPDATENWPQERIVVRKAIAVLAPM